MDSASSSEKACLVFFCGLGAFPKTDFVSSATIGFLIAIGFGGSGFFTEMGKDYFQNLDD